MLRALLVLATACVMTSSAPDAADLVDPERPHRAWRRARHAAGDRQCARRADRRDQRGRRRGSLRARREVDGAGRTLIPGLIDAHVHVTDWALPLCLGMA